MNKGENCLKVFCRNLSITLFIVMISPGMALSQGEGPQIDWISGPQLVDLGSDIAELDMPWGYMFANGPDTVALMKSMGNPPSDLEVGLIAPETDDNANWFIVFEYASVGYIKDDEKDELDADEILESLKEGNEAGNQWRKENNFSPIYLTGWHEKPHYDLVTNNLTWATLLSENNTDTTVNYNIKLLGRNGYVSATVVGNVDELTVAQGEIDQIINGFSFKQGKKYTEFIKGDKIAQYGLVALIAGGAGAVAAKLGLFAILAKYWKAAAVAIVAFFGSMWKRIKSMFGND